MQFLVYHRLIIRLCGTHRFQRHCIFINRNVCGGSTVRPLSIRALSDATGWQKYYFFLDTSLCISSYVTTLWSEKVKCALFLAVTLSSSNLFTIWPTFVRSFKKWLVLVALILWRHYFSFWKKKSHKWLRMKITPLFVTFCSFLLIFHQASKKYSKAKKILYLYTT